MGMNLYYIDDKGCAHYEETQDVHVTGIMYPHWDYNLAVCLCAQNHDTGEYVYFVPKRACSTGALNEMLRSATESGKLILNGNFDVFLDEEQFIEISEQDWEDAPDKDEMKKDAKNLYEMMNN